MNTGEESRYEVKGPLGSGSYGRVCMARDRKMNRLVAIKQARDLFTDLTSTKMTLREVAILSKLDHPGVCRIYDLVVPAGTVKFSEMYIVMELCANDLKKLCSTKVHLNELQVTTLLYNLLAGVAYLHSAGIWHRDLKPANCLVNEDCCVKICDFGLSRAVGGEFLSSSQEVGGQQPRLGRELTGHVATRWYRAPELILRGAYTKAIDIWSVGCIYGELLGMLEGTTLEDRQPLFPGRTCFPLSPNKHRRKDLKFHSEGESDQLSMICSLIGTPTEQDIAQCEEEDARRHMRCIPQTAGIGLKTIFAHLDNICSLDLLEQMLSFDPRKRITATGSLEHAVFGNVRDQKTEIQAEDLVTLDFEEGELLNEKRLRMHLLREVQRYHPEISDD